MRYLYILLCIVVSGCGSLNLATEKTYNALPSAKNCSEVSYHRVNRDITIDAKCTAPVDSGSTLGIPGLT